jgi:predicted nucleic acid-binding protein
MADAVIAGTAAAHELVIVTRNTKHFLPFGIAVLSPDEAAAQGDPT